MKGDKIKEGWSSITFLYKVAGVNPPTINRDTSKCFTSGKSNSTQLTRQEFALKMAPPGMWANKHPDTYIAF